MPVNQETLEVLKVFRSPRGFAFVPVHHSADPDKGPEWAEAERAKYARDADYDREIDIDFGVHLGAKVYAHFRRAVHVVDEIEYQERLPLVLFCDFNASPQAWGVGQVVAGWVHVLDEIFRDPSTIEAGVDEFRNTFPAHKSGVTVYGDASVKSFYDTMKLHFRGYSSVVNFKIPEKNGLVKARCDAVGLRLSPGDGYPGVRIAKKCVNLIQDFEEVVWRPNGKDILKVSDPNDPYSKRTHISDAFGYWIVREWPSGLELGRRVDRHPRKPIVAGKLLGDLSYKHKPKSS